MKIVKLQVLHGVFDSIDKISDYLALQYPGLRPTRKVGHVHVIVIKFVNFFQMGRILKNLNISKFFNNL